MTTPDPASGIKAPLESNTFRTRLERMVAENRCNNVLILGKDSERGSRQTLERLAAELSEKGYRAIIMRDQLEVENMSLHDKLATYVSLSRFVVVVDVEISGHVYEMAVLEALRSPTVILRRPGTGSTWMVAELGTTRNSAKVFSCHERSCEAALKNAVKWVEGFLADKQNTLERTYPDWFKDNLIKCDPAT